MVKEFVTSVGDAYKVSLNFRTNQVRVWIYFHNSWIKHLLSGVLTKREMLEIAYDMTANDFKQFLKTDNFSIWRF